MKVILTTDIEGLGKIGTTVAVKDGYARNFLFPRGLAKAATLSNLKIAEQEIQKLIRIREKEKKLLLELAEKISNVSCTIAVKAGEGDKLFGAVTNDMIAKVCKAEGIEIDKHSIVLDEPIKKIGVYQVPVKLAPETTATLKVWIVKE